MAATGDLLAGKYRLGRLIGEGGMGAVYEAQHELIGKRLAIKMLKPHLVESAEAVGRFTREARAAAAIGHPAIIDVHDLGTAPDGSLFLAMEFLEGQSLGDLLDRTSPLEGPFAAYVLSQVLSALDAAHGKGIVHRDLKPDNVFLVDKGRRLPEVKLLDFGISKIVDRADPGLHLTKTGAVMGTPYYMSPEQARGARDLDHLTDVYATGVMLYECVTGTRPFVQDNFLALVHAVVNTSPLPPRELRPDLPPELEAVIQTAMAKDRAARYQGAAQMLAALLPFVDEESRSHLTLGLVQAAPGTTQIRSAVKSWSAPTPSRAVAASQGTNLAWPSSRAGGGRRLGLVAAGAVGLVLLLGAGAVALWALGGGAADVAPPPPPRVEVAPPPAPDVVTVRLEGVPEAARVSLDGAAVEGRELRRPRTAEEHELRVELEGAQPFTRRVTFERDLTVLVALVPLPAPSPADAGATGPAPRPNVARPPPRPEPAVERPAVGGGKRPIRDRFGTEFE